MNHFWNSSQRSCFSLKFFWTRVSKAVVASIICVIATWALAGCAERPAATLDGHVETQNVPKRVGIVSALGDTLIFTRSNSLVTAESSGDISDWNVDQYVLDTATSALPAGTVIKTVEAAPGALDNVAATTLVTPIGSRGCPGTPSFLPLLDSKSSSCTLYTDSPELFSHPDSDALSSAIRSVLASHAGEADVWIIFRKAVGAAEASDQGIAQLFDSASRSRRMGISIAKYPGAKILGTGGIELQILGRVTLVDGATLAPIADAPLTMPSPPQFLKGVVDVVPFWYLRDEFDVTSWDAYTPQQRQQIHVTVDSLLNSAITQTLKNIGLLPASS